MPKKNHDVGLLLLIIKHLEELKGRTRLQKITYLLKEKYGFDLSYKFMPYYYGPYADDVQNTIDTLSRLDIIKVEPVFLGEGRLLYVHTLTERGKQLTNEVEREIPKEEKEKLWRAIDELNELGNDALIQKAKDLMKERLGKIAYLY